MLLKQGTSGPWPLWPPRRRRSAPSEAAVEEAKVLVEYANIRAPFDAVVLTKNADIGDIVTPLGAAANAKAAVVTIADMNSLQVEVDVSESNISQVRAGQPCEIRLDAFPDLRFKGVVHMIVPTADRTKASVLVKVAFREMNPRILPEMSAKVAFLSRDILPEEEKPLKAVPASAVITRGGAEPGFSAGRRSGDGKTGSDRKASGHDGRDSPGARLRRPGSPQSPEGSEER